MNQERETFLSLIKTSPARMTMEEAGWFLGFSAHEIPVLAAKGLLKPLGHPTANGMKFFAATELEQLRSDVRWLARASDAVATYWRQKNARKTMARYQANRAQAGGALSDADGFSAP